MHSSRLLRSYFIAPWLHRNLLRQLVWREVVGRYRGSMLGLAWAFLTPLLMLAVYTFVFVGVFKARWVGAESGGGGVFALRLFAGLIVFNFFSEVVARAPLLLLEQPNLIKKVVFPLELMPFVTLGSALFHLALSTGILLLGITLFDAGLTWHVLWLPLVMLPLLPLLLGLGWLFGALGVYVRDIGPLVGLAVSFMLFLSPVFYSLASLSARLQVWMTLNPLTPVIENVRRVLFLDVYPDWVGWGYGMVLGALVCWLGAWVFSILRHGFADVV